MESTSVGVKLRTGHCDGEPFSEIGMIAQVTAIQPVMDQPSRSPVDPSMLPEHLRDLLDRTSEGLGDFQRGQLAETLLEFVDLFPIPGSALTGHTEAVEHTIDTGDSLPIRCVWRRCWPVVRLSRATARGRHR